MGPCRPESNRFDDVGWLSGAHSYKIYTLTCQQHARIFFWNSLNNSLATRVGELIGVQIRLLVATVARAPGRFRGAFEEHNDIYQAIRDRDLLATLVAPSSSVSRLAP